MCFNQAQILGTSLAVSGIWREIADLMDSSTPNPGPRKTRNTFNWTARTVRRTDHAMDHKPWRRIRRDGPVRAVAPYDDNNIIIIIIIIAVLLLCPGRVRAASVTPLRYVYVSIRRNNNNYNIHIRDARFNNFFFFYIF